MRVSEITIEELADYLKLNYEDLSAGEIEELKSFFSAAQEFIADYTGLSDEEVDRHPTFAVAAKVLVQDMYDNRCYYADKSNVNQVVKAILDMHCENLL